jgi:hypothetical protein
MRVKEDYLGLLNYRYKLAKLSILSLKSPLQDFHDVRLMLHFLHLLLEFPIALFESLFQGGLSPIPVFFIEIPFLQLSVLILEVFDLLLHHLDGNILGLEFLLDEDVVDLVSLLHDH